MAPRIISNTRKVFLYLLGENKGGRISLLIYIKGLGASGHCSLFIYYIPHDMYIIIISSNIQIVRSELKKNIVIANTLLVCLLIGNENKNQEIRINDEFTYLDERWYVNQSNESQLTNI